MFEDDHVKSTVVELPPDSEGLDEDSINFYRAESVEELARQTSIGDEEVLNRVLLPGKRFGAYHILGFVAAGGMGEIYAAQRIKSDGSRSRPVALKVITAEYANDWRIIERFKREARISKAIKSKHVARVYEFGESPQGHVFLAMELLSGEELFDRLHRERALSAMDLADLSLQILKGLHQIHKSGFVHRDIKPENIFLARDPKTNHESVKILDFGIAKRADQKSDPLLSVVGQIYGTPQYLAPEQAVNPDVDHRADLYSLGVVMYECVSGSLPFEGESAYSFIVAHQNEEIPPLPSTVDPEFAEIIYRALLKDPDHRYQSAIEMGQVLKRWIDETSWVEEDKGFAMDLGLAPVPLERGADPITNDDDLLGTAATTVGMSFRSFEEDEPPGMAPVTGPDRHVPQSRDLLLPPDTGQRARPPIATPLPGIPSVRKVAPIAPTSIVATPEPQKTSDGPVTEDLLPPSSTELRSPPGTMEAREEGGRAAHAITGIALGLLILAILWAFLL